MAHTVYFSTPIRSLKLGKADVEFSVKADSKAMGTLLISRGAVVWVPRDKSKGYRMPWKEFEAMMTKYGRKTRHKQR